VFSRFRSRRSSDAEHADDAGPTPNMVRRPFSEPLSVVDLEPLPPEPVGENEVRVTFWANLRDASGGRCHDVVVDARITGPARTGEGMARTDEYGQVRFRMTGPPGRYRCEITGVGAGTFDLVREDDARIATAEILAARPDGSERE
jgi:hypothetical protein